MKFIVEVSGIVTSKRHRRMEVYASDELSAIEKAKQSFKVAVSNSKGLLQDSNEIVATVIKE